MHFESRQKHKSTKISKCIKFQGPKINNFLESPEINRSTLTPLSTELPEPGQTPNEFMTESKELSTPIATCTVLIPVCFLTHSIASANVIGVAESTSAIRPVPISLFAAEGKMIRDSLCGKALANQSPIAPRLLSHDVCGEYRAIRFSRHTDTNRVFHELKTRKNNK